ncbi:FAD-dependent oxidoreductase [Caldimonas thermodepolymerans]|uniref:Flavocytochrome C n=1 Tax=Caldimonas thermodepolymerans TaxID=215580 RepID=A0A2S5T0V7_9BURK|nr:NAD(P)/FAD-dependent oxidoreductase [Caldimonas thermodepolymerans]PPE68610.1 flavocytochrome C [Caldimonas thermodepolymerans]QPC31988.1 FAD-dependent oxidoreductase [Caldimonas thermodepolymerans]RDI01487.1 sulfide dehydrogenase (flavocytochrome c) flavoprotein subunit [Caldimonas thermodepolymerans]
MQRRSFLQGAAVLGVLGLGACATTSAPSKTKVLVVGGGYGGATAAKYVRLLSDYQIDVVLVEPQSAFVSCPISNLVLGGSKTIADITVPYDNLRKRHGVTVVRDSVARVDPAKKVAVLASGATIGYDKLVLSPGIDLMFDSIEGLQEAHDAGRILQAWKAGPETVALRKQLEAMPDGGVYALTVPEAPYRCPPGPYERVCQVAAYFKAAKPRSKVLLLDANPDVTSKGPLFKKVWAEQYKGIIEYRPQHKAVAVDHKTNTVKFEVGDDVKADVLNVLPTMRAGRIAVDTGLANANGRWCHVNFLNFESTAAKDIHVLGDSIQLAPGMPKSGHMANSHAKVAAAAIVAELNGWEINPAPMVNNTCYSFVDDKKVIHVASVHEYVAAEKTFKTVAGSGGVSPGPTELEGIYAWNWAQNIWSDALG